VIRLWPVSESFGAEVEGVDLRHSPSSESVAAIDAALLRYAVLVIPGQQLTPEQHRAVAAAFGPLEPMAPPTGRDKVGRGDEYLIDVSNLTAAGRPWADDSPSRGVQRANELWHTDSSFKETPARASFLYARSIPTAGGRTEFADLRAAYDALPQSRRDWLEGRIAHHSLATSRRRTGFGGFDGTQLAAMAPVPQLLVRRIPETGRRSLYLASHIGGIEGLSSDGAEEVLSELLTHATQRQFVYSHRWRKGDLVIWDNRCTMHRLRPYDDLHTHRDLQRATTLDRGNTCDLEGILRPAPAHRP